MERQTRSSNDRSTINESMTRATITRHDDTPRWHREALTVVGSAAFVAIRVAMGGGDHGSETAQLMFLLPVIVAAYAVGLRGGLLSTATVALGSAWFILPPYHTFRFDDPMQGAEWALLILTGILISLLSEAGQRARRTSEKANTQLAITFASIGDAVVTTDATGRVTYLNAVAERLTGWTSLGAQGQPIETVLPTVYEEVRTPRESPVRRALEIGEAMPPSHPVILRARDGVETPVSDSAAPIRRPDGRIEGAVLVVRNVTAERSAARSCRLVSNCRNGWHRSSPPRRG
jgi:PAS domain S-box-containing protein